MYGLEEPADTDLLDDRQIIARTAWGEARGEGNAGMQAVICTGQNRLSSGVRWWGYTLKTIFLHPWQYSCWNATDPNRAKLLQVTEDDAQFAAALGLADTALSGNLPDNTNGANSYFDARISKPKWATNLTPTEMLGHHLFYKV